MRAAGFGYEVYSIENGDANELARAFKSLFAAITEVRLSEFIFTTFPVLRKLFVRRFSHEFSHCGPSLTVLLDDHPFRPIGRCKEPYCLMQWTQ